MKVTFRQLSAALGAALVASAAPLTAQDDAAAPQQYNQVISANPIGLLFEFFNAEYERVFTPFSTLGVGGSYFNADSDDEDPAFQDGEEDTYLNADVFYRYYPQGTPLDGFAFGVKAGLTQVEGQSFFGAGFDANYSWLLGKQRNFYVGVGVGAKRLLGVEDTDYIDLEFIPTIRLVNIGWAF